MVRLRSLALSIDLRYKATDIALGKRQNRITGPRGTGSDKDLSEYDLSSSESDSSSVLSSGGRSVLGPTTEMKELMSAIRTGLDSLFKASIFIRNFASKDKRLRAAETKPFNSRADIMYIIGRYPLLKHNATLATRLGEANARRRQYFEYRRDHYEHLSTVATKGDSVNVRAQAHPVVRIAAPATPVLTPVLTAETIPSLLADTEATAFMADEAALDWMLRTPGVPEAMSAVSFATSVAEISDEELAFPLVPVEAETGSFLCPYCFQYQQLRREGLGYQWRCEEMNLL